MGRSFYYVGDIANILGVHKTTVRRWVREGHLKGNRVCKEWMIPKKEIDEMKEILDIID